MLDCRNMKREIDREMKRNMHREINREMKRNINSEIDREMIHMEMNRANNQDTIREKMGRLKETKSRIKSRHTSRNKWAKGNR